MYRARAFVLAGLTAACTYQPTHTMDTATTCAADAILFGQIMTLLSEDPRMNESAAEDSRQVGKWTTAATLALADELGVSRKAAEDSILFKQAALAEEINTGDAFSAEYVLDLSERVTVCLRQYPRSAYERGLQELQETGTDD